MSAEISTKPAVRLAEKMKMEMKMKKGLKDGTLYSLRRGGDASGKQGSCK